MTITNAFEGEDVPLRVAYEDDAGDGTEADSVPSITITDPADTAQVDGSDMSDVGDAGEYEFVWDTASDSDGTGTYTIEIEAEFSTETKINREEIDLR